MLSEKKDNEYMGGSSGQCKSHTLITGSLGKALHDKIDVTPINIVLLHKNHISLANGAD